jgi:hypothetical protein
MLKKITSVDWRLVSDLGPMAATPMGPKSDGTPVRFAVFPVQPDGDMGDQVLRRFGRFDDLQCDAGCAATRSKSCSAARRK